MKAEILSKRKYFPVFPGFYGEKMPRFLKQTRIFYGIFFYHLSIAVSGRRWFGKQI